MSIRINTSTEHLAALRNLRKNSQAESASVEKLASGSRINRAADDAAGLGVAEKLRATGRSLQQAVRNASDGISVVQVAEGAMAELSNLIVRMRELAIQGASDTVGDFERGFIDNEIGTLVKEVDRIALSTKYLDHELLATEAKYLEIQIGVSNNPDADRAYLDVRHSWSTVERLKLNEVGAESKDRARGSLQQLDAAMTTISRNRAAMGAMQNRLQSGLASLGVYGENVAGARSRITDTDMAAETAEMTRANILAQTSVAVLTQANQSSNLALKLLG